MTEKQRIKSILAGDTQRFGYFVDTYQDMAITIAYRICGNMQDAEDIVQNAFVKAYHNLASFRDRSKFSSWLYRIVYNTALTAINKTKGKKEYIDYQFVDQENIQSKWETLDLIEEKEKTAIINQALSQLHPSETMVLTLFYMEDMPTKEIVKITGLSKSNVKIKLHRGRQNLAKILNKNKVVN